MSAKRLFQMRSQGLLKSSYVTGAALRPLYVVISKTLKHLENSTLSQVRNNIIKASEEIERFKQYANLPPLYGVGGTAIGGYEPLPTPDPPYLPEQEGGSGYCLVLDLDETLVHYFEVGSEGTFLVRPGCDQFLTEMAEIYEVVIFTAAMQDVSTTSNSHSDEPHSFSIVRRLGAQPNRQSQEDQVPPLQITCAASRPRLRERLEQDRPRSIKDNNRRQRGGELPAATRQRNIHKELVRRHE